jgi:uncharacterized protein YbjT (DUF2867 family)
MPLIDQAKKTKVQHIVALTAMGVEQDDTFMLRILEKYIEASGIPYTHLRPNWFMQNFSRCEGDQPKDSARKRRTHKTRKHG